MIRKKLQQLRAKKRNVTPLIQALLDGHPLVGMDVGAAKGLMPHWLTLDGAATFYGVEPNRDSHDELMALVNSHYCATNYKLLSDALYSYEGEQTLYVTHVPTGSSLLKPIEQEASHPCYDKNYFFPLKEVPLFTTTLEKVCERENISTLDFIKLDVQGVELDILKGLDKPRLDKLLCIEAEVSLEAHYEGQNLFSDWQEFFAHREFDLFDIRVARACSRNQKQLFDTHPNMRYLAGRVTELDVVYFAKPARLIAKRDAVALRKLIVLYCTYNYFNDAVHLVERATEAGVFSKYDTDILLNQIRQWFEKRFFRFYHQPKPFYNWLRKQLRRCGLDPSLQWARYMWVEYPNS